jgi:hypothetical protein
MARVELLRKSERDVESVVQGRSMEPAIAVGDQIRIRPVQRMPDVGTAVAVVTPGGLVAHRVIDRGYLPWNRGFVLTQGDGTMLCDPPVPVSLVLGEVCVRRHDGGWQAIGPRAQSARSTACGARLWRFLVRCAFAAHPRMAAMLVRWSLRGRVAPVNW